MKPQLIPGSRHAYLLNLFLDGYATMCGHMSPFTQKGLLEAAPLVFSKWYDTALATDTILSPANIIGQDLEDGDTDTEYAYTLYPDFEAEDMDRYNFQLLAYSLEHHPLLEDLKILTDFCVPDRQMDENLFFLEGDRPYLLSKLSQKSDFYLEYLTRLGWWLGLFSFMPSIHIKKIQRAPYCDTFFQMDLPKILETAAIAACELASERFSFSMDLEQGVASPAFFRECLESGSDTDRIFVDFYKQVDVDIEEIWQTAPDALTEDDKAIVSSVLFTGIMLDKWFLFPMRSFFHLIRPITFTPIRYYHLVNNLAALLTMEHNIGSEIFGPPTYYNLTSLGAALFGKENAEEEKYQLPAALSYEDILRALEQEMQVHQLEKQYYMDSVKEVISIKISRQSDPDLWKIIEADVRFSLDEFCKDLCAVFAMEDVVDYVLAVPNSNRFPVEYSPLGSKRSVNKTTGKTLVDMGWHTGQSMTLTPAIDTLCPLTLRVETFAEADPHILYPRVASQSSKITALEQVDEIF